MSTSGTFKDEKLCKINIFSSLKITFFVRRNRTLRKQFSQGMFSSGKDDKAYTKKLAEYNFQLCYNGEGQVSFGAFKITVFLSS